MIAASRRWFKRYRTPVAVGAGVIGCSYLATQYLFGKILDARIRVTSDRIAQEKCVFLILIPHLFTHTDENLVSDVALNKIKKTVH